MEDIKGLLQREFTSVDMMYMLWSTIMQTVKLPTSLEQVMYRLYFSDVLLPSLPTHCQHTYSYLCAAAGHLFEANRYMGDL